MAYPEPIEDVPPKHAEAFYKKLDNFKINDYQKETIFAEAIEVIKKQESGE